MTCQHAHLDGAYVLGALSPAERGDFEKHLTDCEACARAVQGMAGIPGLLARVDAGVLESLPVEQEQPDTLLPALVARVRRSRRRRTFVTAGLAAAAASAVVVGSLAITGALTDDTRPSPPQATSTPTTTPTTDPTTAPTTPAPPRTTPKPTPKAAAMTAIGGAPVRGHLALEPVAWGTRLDLTCSYGAAPGGHGYALPASYAMFIRTRDGRVERVATWRALPGRTMRLTAATASVRADITQVEVRTDGGQAVLRLVS